MSVTAVIDAREWIYSLAKDAPIGRSDASYDGSGYTKRNGNFITTVRRPVHIVMAASKYHSAMEVAVPAGAELVVYRALSRLPNGGWALGRADNTLAAIFLKDDGRVVEQITVRMDGRITRRCF